MNQKNKENLIIEKSKSKKSESKMKSYNKNNGFVILFTAVLSSIVLAISLGVASIALKEINFSTSAKDTNEAFFASDTGVECALFNDKTGSSVFTETGSGEIECMGETITLSGSYPVWTFVVSGMGEEENSCARVKVDKTNIPVVEVTSEGFNTGDADCNSTNPFRVERELSVKFNEAPPEEQKIFIGGNFTTYNGVTMNRVALLNSDGTLDTSFSNSGTGPNTLVYSSYILPDGKILIGGNFTSYNGTSINRIAKLNQDGSLDMSFNVGTGFNDTVLSIFLQSDGKILLSGPFSSYNGTLISRVARLNSDGSLDSTFNPPIINSNINSVFSLSDGKIIIAGSFTSLDAETRGRIARLNANGSIDWSFLQSDSGANNLIYKAIPVENGKIMIVGAFTTVNDYPLNRIARLNENGSVDSTFNIGNGFNTNALVIDVLSDEKIAIAGNFATYNSLPRNRFVVINNDGSVFSTSTTGPEVIVRSQDVQYDNKILVGGSFTAVSGIPRGRIARMNPDGTVDTSFDSTVGANDVVYTISVK